ncbi:MAG: hypothetical protein KF905_13550 [Flavobacteriales bacterium]|nr:hypothetical protein [Flavobacteriales bacterium]
MTHHEQLDQVLRGLLHRESDPASKRMRIGDLVRTVASTEEKWEVDLIIKRLLDDGYMARNRFDPMGEPHIITSTGMAHIQRGGYVSAQEELSLDKAIKQGTLRSFRYDKLALLVAAASLIISIVALFNS